MLGFEIVTYTKKIDVEGLGIVVTSSTPTTEDPSKPKAKGKSKAKAAGQELISDGHLRLKGGVHYGLLGRNGTGKSSKAKLLPWGRYQRCLVDICF